MPSKKTVRSAVAVVIALSLTFGAGFVDAFGYLKLSHVYTANLSGNTVLIGIKATGGQPSMALLHAFTIGMFLTGLLVSGVLIELAIRRGFRRVLGATMVLEALLLAGFAGFSSTIADLDRGPSGWHLYALLAIAAVTMGMQNTSLRMAGILTVYTTHVTGAVTRFSEHAVAWLFAVRDQRQDRNRDVGQPQSRGEAHGRPAAELSQAMLSGGIWAAFLGGACISEKIAPRWGVAALAWPIAIVVSVGALDCVWPLARLRGGTRGQPL